ncbi:MAG: bifunctional glutamate N-acetyltransferase/amino-acid acetyltransferase ArgJ [Victivallaceae bacterium]|nr:bifunctional glutamate N-acetyltransferase/amino-acid acetyltransferase ArgJ [Victivallaceae bacterium]
MTRTVKSIDYEFIENGSVTSPNGFKAAGVVCGLKRSGAPDLAVLYSHTPATFSAAFTSCVFAAAPVQLGRKQVLEQKTLRAVVINSGNANACTSETGLQYARETCELAARKLGVRPEEVMVSSTGRIGVQLPMDIIAAGVEKAAAALASDAGAAAAAAIMTTDTVPKSAAVSVKLSSGTVCIGAMTKGAGMIDPNLRVPHATMLCYITTDAEVPNSLLRDFLSRGVDNSFNRITIDGDMSTNDTVLIMANGSSGVKVVPGSEDAEIFYEALLALMQQLAYEMVMDGEGATKFVTVYIEHARDETAARTCAEAIANSLLCKTAWFGCDPNWGRIVAALGYAGIDFDPALVNIFYNDKAVVTNGGDAGTPEKELAEILKAREFSVSVDMNAGNASYWMWTCDVSYEYVKINAEYHT